MRCHEGQQEYCSSCLAQKWQMLADQVFLFARLQQLDRRVLYNIDDAAQAPWRPTRLCRLSLKVPVHVGICAPRHTSWTGSCDAPGASEVPHEWQPRYDRISCILRIRHAAEWMTDCSGRRWTTLDEQSSVFYSVFSASSSNQECVQICHHYYICLIAESNKHPSALLTYVKLSTHLNRLVAKLSSQTKSSGQSRVV